MSLDEKLMHINPDEVLRIISKGRNRDPDVLRKWFEHGCTVDQVAARLIMDSRYLATLFARETAGMSLADYAKELYKNSPLREREERINGEDYRGPMPLNSRPRSERLIRLGRYGKKHY